MDLGLRGKVALVTASSRGLGKAVAVALAEARAKRAGTTPAEEIRRMEAVVPVGRLGDPAEFAAVAAFLCGEPARYVTGTTLAVDGGMCRGLL